MEQEADFQTRFWAARRALAAASEHAFARHGIHAGQQYVLLRLWEQDGMTPGELARALGLATPTVTRTATRMQAAGLLQRRPHPTDGRLVQLWLTSRGRALQRAIERELEQLSGRALATLSARERGDLLRYLDEIRANLAPDEDL